MELVAILGAGGLASPSVLSFALFGVGMVLWRAWMGPREGDERGS